MSPTPAQQAEVSVIIPVRNASGCVRACIRSLQKQTRQDLEFIFVDDASSDSTCAIISKAAQRDSRIILLQQPQQGGPGVARNRGIEAARGKYIGFVDADDAVNPGFYEALCRKAELNQAWVVKGSCIKTTACGLEKVSGLNERIRQGLANGHSLLELFNYEHWTGLYLRDFINRVGARNGDCTQGEDNIFLMQVMCHLPVERFATEDSAVYYYRVNEGSVSTRYDAEFLEQSYISLCKRLEYMATQPDSPAAQAFVAGQFEEKLYHRVVQVWGSILLTQVQLCDYLEKCIAAIRRWLADHPDQTLGKYSSLVSSADFSASALLAALKQDSGTQNISQMPKDEDEQLRRKKMLLSRELKIRKEYWRCKIMSVLLPRSRSHYHFKMQRLSAEYNVIKHIKGIHKLL